MNAPPAVITPGPPGDRAITHRVQVRDGVHLATDVYLAEGAAPGPVVLIRTPYDKCDRNGQYAGVARIFGEHGYHVVVQDVRGKFRSEGETLQFSHETYDAYDTLDWLVAQPWSDGRVGAWGASYHGFTAWAAAASGHPALRAISPLVTGTGLGEYHVEETELPTRPVEIGYALLYNLIHYHGNDTYLWDVDWTSHPYTAQIDEHLARVGHRSASFDLGYPHAARPRRFPNGSPFDQPPVPTLLTIGWWDNVAPHSWRDWREIVTRADWSEHVHLRIDSIDHTGNELPVPGQTPARRDAGLEAFLPQYLAPTITFFDRYVKNLPDAPAVPRVSYNVAGTSEWRTAQEWPPPEAPEYAWAGARATEGAHGADAVHQLVIPADATPADPGTTLQLPYRPDAPVVSPGGPPSAYLATDANEAALTDRDDVLAFDTDTIDTPQVLIGRVALRLTMDSTGASGDLFARLVDVAPDGTGRRIARGQVHVVDLSQPRRIAIDLGYLGYRLETGHRLRLHLHASDTPEFVLDPGTGERAWSATRFLPATHRIHLGAPTPLELTITRDNTVIDAFERSAY